MKAILTGDWHLRESAPGCRMDDFVAKQWRKVDYIKALAIANQAHIVHAGDLFHQWKPSPWLISSTIKYLPNTPLSSFFYTIYGNHDLPQHNIDLAYKTGISCLEQINRLNVLKGRHWNCQSNDIDYAIGDKKVLVWHIMTWQGKCPAFAKGAYSAEDILHQYPEYDLIVTGHNHNSFMANVGGRLLVNPGAITRQTMGETHLIPRVYIYDSVLHSIEEVVLPYNKDVFVDTTNERSVNDTRVEEYIAHLNSNWDADISFEKNLEKFSRENAINDDIMQVIWNAIKE